MKTIFILLAQYDGLAVIPVEIVCQDYFPHINATGLVGKFTRGEIALPLMRIESGQKSARGVHSTTWRTGSTRAGRRRSKNCRQMTE